MNLLKTIGSQDGVIEYVDRPTVKIVIRRGDAILILNQGLLPGGGVDPGESNVQAIQRELMEELAVVVDNIRGVGEVVQYRNYLGKKYHVYGYQADFVEFSGVPFPQDNGESKFTSLWLTKHDALNRIAKSIDEQKSNHPNVVDDWFQGRLYNLMTAQAIVDAAE